MMHADADNGIKKIWLKTLFLLYFGAARLALLAPLRHWPHCSVKQHDDAAHVGAVNRRNSAIHETVLIAPPVALYAPALIAAVDYTNETKPTHTIIYINASITQTYAE